MVKNICKYHTLSIKHANLGIANIKSKKSAHVKICLCKFIFCAEFKPKILCETETFDVANAIVASGVGACFSISGLIKEDKKDKIKLFDIDEPSLAKTLVIAYKKDKKLSELTSEFIKMAKEC
ncbi:hypothetical protein [Campylobacter majalis]|uniref:hypothetical protein n=1 Tax=Campylobacter majalis TaxID=2790656 RepID=UPI003D68BCBD